MKPNKLIYSVKGITCNNCVEKIVSKSLQIKGVLEAKASIEASNLTITTSEKFDYNRLQKAISSIGFSIKRNEVSYFYGIANAIRYLKPFYPLILIFLYLLILVLSYQLAKGDKWNIEEMLLHFMAGFFIIFSFFKLLDLGSFSISFRKYDPLATIYSPYSYAYPFIELSIGIIYYLNIKDIMLFTNIAVILILLPTTFGIIRTLQNKKDMQCACLGTAIRLPLTKVTVAENGLMILMAFFMVLKNFI